MNEIFNRVGVYGRENFDTSSINTDINNWDVSNVTEIEICSLVLKNLIVH